MSRPPVPPAPAASRPVSAPPEPGSPHAGSPLLAPTLFHRWSDRTRRGFAFSVAFAAVVGALLLAADAGADPPAAAPEAMLSHAVFFTLNDPTAAKRDELVAACRKYLTGHDGTAYFAAGPRAEAATRAVNDTDFDVSLLIVFESQAAHDAYQVGPAARRVHRGAEGELENGAGVRRPRRGGVVRRYSTASRRPGV